VLTPYFFLLSCLQPKQKQKRQRKLFIGPDSRQSMDGWNCSGEYKYSLASMNEIRASLFFLELPVETVLERRVDTFN